MRPLLKKNKKGQQLYGILIFIVALVLIMFFGLAFAIGGAVLDWGSDEISPVLSDLGVVGSTNLSQVAQYTVTPVDNVIQSLSWLIGILYFVMLIGAMMLAFMYRSSGNKILVAFFFVLIIVLVLISIFVSNTYESIYAGSDAIASRLQEQTITSFLIIQSPMVMLIIGLIAGIIMFTPNEREVYV
jgi:hypothetical protein